MNIHAYRYGTDKAQQMANTPAQSFAGKLAIQLQDNRPAFVIQKKQVDAMSAKQAFNAIIQKKANNPVLPNKQPIQMAGGSWKSWAATAAAGLGAAALITGAAPITGAIGLAGGLGYLGYTAYRRYQRGPAEDIRRRAGERGAVRRANNRFAAGQYDAATGPVGVSGMNRQRIAQTNKDNYNDETMGSIPPYSAMQAEMAPEDVAFIHDPAARRSPGMPTRRRMAAGLAMTASNVSEEDKAPGIGKKARTMIYQFIDTLQTA